MVLVFISVVTVSELLVGVHRANSEERRLRRSQFVEAIIAGVSILDFTLGVARLHSELHAELTKRGERIGAHDLMIAATAIHHNLPLLAQNIEEFRRVPGLQVVAFNEPT